MAYTSNSARSRSLEIVTYFFLEQNSEATKESHLPISKAEGVASAVSAETKIVV